MKKIIDRSSLDKIVGGVSVPKKARYKVGKRPHKIIVFRRTAPLGESY